MLQAAKTKGVTFITEVHFFFNYSYWHGVRKITYPRAALRKVSIHFEGRRAGPSAQRQESQTPPLTHIKS